REAGYLEAEPERDRRGEHRRGADRKRRVASAFGERGSERADELPERVVEARRERREAVVVEDGQEEVEGGDDDDQRAERAERERSRSCRRDGHCARTFPFRAAGNMR